MGFDIGGEGLTVHGAGDDPGCDEGVGGHARDEGLGAPSAEGCGSVQAFTLGRTAARPGHVGLDAGLVDEGQPLGQGLGRRQPVPYPVGPGPGDIGPSLLVCDQRLFLYVKPRRPEARDSEV